MLTTIFIILLIISQLFCFYIIALLNAKVAKFKDLEIRQERMMREMEESISLYLVEIREENDRLINELSQGTSTKQERKIEDTAISHVEQPKSVANDENINSIEHLVEQKVFVPKAVARNAYNKYKTQPNSDDQEASKSISIDTEPEAPLTFEQQVIKLHNEGKNIEEIAKLTNKGKTEIELLLKFQV